MNSVALNLALGSTGLALTACVTWVALALCRRRPLAGYRLSVLVLVAVLLLPLGQIAARASGSELVHPLRSWIEALRAPEEVAPAQVAESEPVALGANATRVFDTTPMAASLLGQQGAADLSAGLRASGRAADFERIALRSLVALYFAGVLVFLVRMARRVLRTRALIQSARPVEDKRVLDLWREVSATSPLGRGTRLALSDEVKSPACLGIVRPIVILPDDRDQTFDLDVLRCIFVHELVHLERRDAWVLVGEELLRVLFWFHPATWWLVRELEHLRELSCDLLVVRRTGTRRRYARALVAYAEWMQFGRTERGASVHSVPWFKSKDQLSKRIEMLLQSEPKSAPATRLLAPGVVGSLLLFLWTGQLALASSCASTKPACDRDCDVIRSVNDDSDTLPPMWADADGEDECDDECDESQRAEVHADCAGACSSGSGTSRWARVAVAAPDGCCPDTDKCEAACDQSTAQRVTGRALAILHGQYSEAVYPHSEPAVAHGSGRSVARVLKVPRGFKSCECQPGVARCEVVERVPSVIVLRGANGKQKVNLDEIRERIALARVYHGDAAAALQDSARLYRGLELEPSLMKAREAMRVYADVDMRAEVEKALAEVKKHQGAAKALESARIYEHVAKALADANIEGQLEKALAETRVRQPRQTSPRVAMPRGVRAKAPRSKDLAALEQQLAEMEAKLADQRKAMEELRERLRASDPSVH